MSDANILRTIVEQKERELPALRERSRREGWAERCRSAPKPPSFEAALRRPGRMRVIAEMKKASPSAGVIRESFDPSAIAMSYWRGGADCLSVLTDEKFFQGSVENLRIATRTTPLPALRKDFVLDECQVHEARLAGAAAVLLIAECLTAERTKTLVSAILELEMTPLVELYEPANLPAVLASGTPLVGINNRDLRTFRTDICHTIDLLADIPKDRLVVSESGIRTREDVARLREAGVAAILVGEAFMRAADPGAKLAELVG